MSMFLEFGFNGILPCCCETGLAIVVLIFITDLGVFVLISIFKPEGFISLKLSLSTFVREVKL